MISLTLCPPTPDKILIKMISILFFVDISDGLTQYQSKFHEFKPNSTPYPISVNTPFQLNISCIRPHLLKMSLSRTSEEGLE